MPWLSVVGAIAGPVISGITGKKSADKASSVQQQADAEAIAVQRESLAEQKRQFDLGRGDLANYRRTGGAALGQLEAGISGGVEGAARKILRLFPSWTTTGIPGQPGTAAEIVESFVKHAPEIVGRGGAAFGYEGYGPETYDLLRELQPYMEGATHAPDLTRKFTMEDMLADPVYQSGLKFGLDRGTRGIEQNAARSGTRHSGNTLKALTQFGTDYGNTKGNESYNRFKNDQTSVYNMLAGVAGTGQTAANTGVNAGQNYANAVSGINNNMAGILSSGGNARGAAVIAGGNALGGVGTNISNWWNQQQTLDKLINARGTGGTSGGSNYSGLYGASYGAGGDQLYG